MFELCLFDLDDTLVLTSDMSELRLSGKRIETKEYKSKIQKAYRTKGCRKIYKQDDLLLLKERMTSVKLGVFTRSPRAYASTILKEAYPDILWDIIIAYEDVKRTKPFGEGIRRAMDELDIDRLDKVVLVGDGDADIRAAYNGGVPVVLDRSSWAERRSFDNWRAINHMPDAIIDAPDELLDTLQSLPSHSLELERLLAQAAPVERTRFDWIGKFVPDGIGVQTGPHKVFTCGRSFANYESLSERRKWHLLSASIQENKESSEFPTEWIQALKGFIRKKFWNVRRPPALVVTVVPHRPGRTPRLENMLLQLERSVRCDEFFYQPNIFFEPQLLAYRDGVRSQSGDHLNQVERFENVRDHLVVAKPELLEDGKKVLIIDDVCTTGASLIFAGIRLEEAGSGETTRFSIAMNVSDVLPHE